MGNGDNSEPSTSGFPDFTKLERVQDILDRNRLVVIADGTGRQCSRAQHHSSLRCRSLLFQIKANHEAQKPEGLAKNFALLREVNSNIDKASRGGLCSLGSGPPCQLFWTAHASNTLHLFCR